ncbi:MAG: hypothetical protein DHS20C08_13360 [Rhodomicrobium sp.]|nr:MAG: hypothetical protein DHS20C08_13360 [Rhodomicrobium sp.]
MVRHDLAQTLMPFTTGKQPRAITTPLPFSQAGMTRAKPFLRAVIIKAQKHRHRRVTALINARLSNPME